MKTSAAVQFRNPRGTAELQVDVVDLFNQDYSCAFGYCFDGSQDRNDLQYRRHTRAHFILRWIIGIGSDSPVEVQRVCNDLDADVMERLFDFLFTIRDELPESWRRRAVLLSIINK